MSHKDERVTGSKNGLEILLVEKVCVGDGFGKYSPNFKHMISILCMSTWVMSGVCLGISNFFHFHSPHLSQLPKTLRKTTNCHQWRRAWLIILIISWTVDVRDRAFYWNIYCSMKLMKEKSENTKKTNQSVFFSFNGSKCAMQPTMLAVQLSMTNKNSQMNSEHGMKKKIQKKLNEFESKYIDEIYGIITMFILFQMNGNIKY